MKNQGLMILTQIFPKIYNKTKILKEKKKSFN